MGVWSLVAYCFVTHAHLRPPSFSPAPSVRPLLAFLAALLATLAAGLFSDDRFERFWVVARVQVTVVTYPAAGITAE
jgi:hypothetical protein